MIQGGFCSKQGIIEEWVMACKHLFKKKGKRNKLWKSLVTKILMGSLYGKL